MDFAAGSELEELAGHLEGAAAVVRRIAARIAQPNAPGDTITDGPAVTSPPDPATGFQPAESPPDPGTSDEDSQRSPTGFQPVDWRDKLTLTQRAIYAALAAAPGSFLTTRQLSKAAGCEESSTRVYLGRIRRELPDGYRLESSWGRGYALLPPGVDLKVNTSTEDLPRPTRGRPATADKPPAEPPEDLPTRYCAHEACGKAIAPERAAKASVKYCSPECVVDAQNARYYAKWGGDKPIRPTVDAAAGVGQGTTSGRTAASEEGLHQHSEAAAAAPKERQSGVNLASIYWKDRARRRRPATPIDHRGDDAAIAAFMADRGVQKCPTTAPDYPGLLWNEAARKSRHH